MNGKAESRSRRTNRCQCVQPCTRTHVRRRACVHAEVARGIAFNVVALRCTWPGHAIALLRNWQGWSQQYRGSCDRYG